MDQAPAKAKRRTRQKSHLQIRLTTEIVQNKKGATIFGVDRHLVCWLLFLYHLSFKYFRARKKDIILFVSAQPCE